MLHEEHPASDSKVTVTEKKISTAQKKSDANDMEKKVDVMKATKRGQIGK